jgi:hypothetical protein
MPGGVFLTRALRSLYGTCTISVQQWDMRRALAFRVAHIPSAASSLTPPRTAHSRGDASGITGWEALLERISDAF